MENTSPARAAVFFKKIADMNPAAAHRHALMKIA
jgi:hypothetical protein